MGGGQVRHAVGGLTESPLSSCRSGGASGGLTSLMVERWSVTGRGWISLWRSLVADLHNCFYHFSWNTAWSFMLLKAVCKSARVGEGQCKPGSVHGKFNASQAGSLYLKRIQYNLLPGWNLDKHKVSPYLQTIRNLQLVFHRIHGISCFGTESSPTW